MSPHRLKNIAALTAAAFCAFTAPAGAASLTWNGGASGDWQNGAGGWLNGGAANWNNATPDSAVFDGAPTNAVTINAGGVTVDDITISAGTYSIAGPGTLTLASTTWSVASGLTNTVSAALAGTTGLTKSGSGVLLFSGANKNFTGGVAINGGAVQIASAAAGALGTANNTAVALNGGALYSSFSGDTTVNYAIAVGASGGELRNLGTDSQRFIFSSSTVSGSGTLTLSFGTNNTRFTMGTTTQSSFNGKWVIDSGSNVNRFVDVGGASTFGNVSGDDAITLSNVGAILFRTTGTYGTNSSGTYGITVGSGGGNIATGGGQTVNLAAKITGAEANSIRFDLGNATSVLILSNTANSWLGATTLAGSGTMRLGASGVIADNGGTIDMASTTTLNLNGFSEAIGGISGSGGINNSGSAATLTVGGNNQSSTFSGAISNSGGALSLVKAGSGTLTLSGNSTYGGATTISGGALQVGTGGTSGSIGSTSGVTNDGTLAYNRSDNITASYAISGTGVLTKSGTGTLTLSGANTYSGVTTINAGVLEITNGSAIADAGAVTLSNASGVALAVSTSETIGSLRGGGATGGNVSIASGQTLTVAETGGQAFAGAISNSGSLAKSGAGTLTLSSSSSSYSGGTTVRGGRLVASNANALGSGNILLQADSTSRATLVLNNITMTGKTLTMDSTTNRAILLSGSSGGATWNGDIVLTGGASANGTTELANDTGNGPLTVAGTVTGSIAGGAFTLRGAGVTTTNVLSAGVSIGSTPLAKTDDGVWQITSSGNAWSGTTISAGVLSVGNGGATGELGGGGITNNATLVVNRSGMISVTNTISGSGALTKSGTGTLTLTATNSYAGGTAIGAGKLVVNGSIASSAVTVSNGAALGGSGTVGSTVVNSGATIAPGNSPGNLTINGDLTWNNGGSYDWEVFRVPGEGSAGTDWDLLSVTGSLNLTNLTGAPLFNINLYSLSATNSAGPLANWSNTGTYAWKILQATNAIANFNAGYFNIVTTGFSAHNNISGGLFALELGDSNTGLYLTYKSGSAVPEPGTWAAAALLAGGAAFVRWRRRLNKVKS